MTDRKLQPGSAAGTHVLATWVALSGNMWGPGHFGPLSLYRREGSSLRGFGFTSCSVHEYQVVQVLSWLSLEDSEAGWNGHEGSRLWTEKWLVQALEDEKSYGFGACTKCLCLPLHALLTKSPGTVDLGLGALSFANRAYITCFTLCADFLVQEKDWEYQGTLSDIS